MQRFKFTLYFRLPNDLEISRIVQENGLIHPWIKTSAKSGEGVKDAFKLIVRYIMAMDTWNPPISEPFDSILAPSGAESTLSSPEYQRNRAKTDDSAKAEEPKEEENVIHLQSTRSSTTAMMPFCLC